MIMNKLKNFIPAPIKSRIKVGHYASNLTQRIRQLENENEKVTLIIGTPTHTNLGDHLITMAQFRYLEVLGYSQRIIEVPTEMYQIFRSRIRKIPCINTIFINGGGWMGNLWIPEELLIQQIVRDFFDKKIVVFPQTVYFDKKIQPYNSLIISANKIFAKCKDVTLCVRENNSYNFSINHYTGVKILLVPDIALSYYQWAPKNHYKDHKRIGLCLRKDRERYETEEKKQNIINWFIQNGYSIDYIDTMNKHRVNIEEREDRVLQRLKVFSGYDFVVTDRLHGMIFSYICGTPCIVFDNKTHKVSGVYNTWLSDSKKILPMFKDSECGNLEEFVTSDLNFDENVCPLDRFNDLKEIIQYGED
ncbi:General stress protein 30 [Blautia hydrogenotrophica]|uniref:polysaccharide pyruvyl transferase family protein n=1 Tax=Blautia hydrogenotrophica TaxID=53443 RepID=UPI0006C4AC66|nr:polysaccharide pyruvyl transferase family protein [Blautia hydrogenotrophica]CUM97574.1 General stress protein 30 [Blautia hydrogenotrophica]SCH89722.1 General stress protein 30 [uncultured Blautia sp.]